MNDSDWRLAVLMGGIHFTFHVLMRLIPALIPVLAVSLDYPLGKLGVLVSVSLVGSSIGLLPMGVLSDSHDRQAILSGALGVAGLGFVLFSGAHRLGAGFPAVDVLGTTLDGPYQVMCAAMFVVGLGLSAHVPVGIPFLTKNATPGARGRVLGAFGAGSKFGDAATPAAVGVLILAFGWSRILLLFGAFGVAGSLALFAILERSAFDTQPGGDAADGASESGPTNPNDASGDATSGRGAAPANVAPTGPDRLLADRRQYLYPMIALLGYFAAYSVVVQGTVAFTPAFIADTYGYTVGFGGVEFGPESFADFALAFLLVAAGASRLLGGALVDRYEGRVVLFWTLVIATGALYAFSTLSLGPVAILVVLSVFGIGIWGNSPARDSLISDITPADRQGRTFSYLFTASRLFGALSPAIIGFMAESAGLRQGFRYLAGATLVAALFVALLFSDRVYAETVARDGPATDD